MGGTSKSSENTAADKAKNLDNIVTDKAARGNGDVVAPSACVLQREDQPSKLQRGASSKSVRIAPENDSRDCPKMERALSTASSRSRISLKKQVSMAVFNSPCEDNLEYMCRQTYERLQVTAQTGQLQEALAGRPVARQHICAALAQASQTGQLESLLQDADFSQS